MALEKIMQNCNLIS